MKVRAKLISVLALLFAVMIALEVMVQTQVLMPSFAELERDDARVSMKRIDSALNGALDDLERSAADWGNWADVYDFVETPTQSFVDRNITGSALKQLQANAIFIADRKGNLVLAAGRDLDSGAPLDLSITEGNVLPPQAIAPRGLVRTKEGIMLVASAPVLDGSGKGESRGVVIMGKLLTASQLRILGAQSQVDVVLTPARDATGVDRLVETGTVTQVLRPLFDIYGSPLVTLRVEVPRKITARGAIAVTYAAACIVVGGMLALLALVVVLNRVVVGPLARVTRHAVMLGEGADLSARLNLPGRDEVAVLAREFDRMVERVADTRRQLMDQSFQAGFAELAKGVLHNLGNAMTPLAVRLAKLDERLRAAPAADIELAADELMGEMPGTTRHDDLREFLRLAGRQVAVSVTEAQADLAVVQRQAVIVQTALAELMRSTRNDHLLESVRLPELVSQTLEIVPDACRQRLQVEADDSLHRVGVVHVARTVLRLVLQNLIINAADAVRDSGREHGRLRVAAEIVRDAEREQLHLHCADDGIGIAADNLDRVFERGFSTKSRDTNHGIGLHWCANAIAALGGRIWAVSDGPGRGACLHLLVPLTVPEA